MKSVTIRHPEHEDLTAEVHHTSVPTWELSGWTVVDDESDVAESVPAEEAVPESGPADPDDPDEE